MHTVTIPPNLLAALTHNPYINKLYIFGSRAVFDDDQFSDIDLTAITDYPEVAEDYTRKTLEGQFGIIATYTISQNNHEIARSLFLSGMSLFHKLDIGFSLPNQTKLFPNSALLFNNNHAKQPDKKSVKTWTESPWQHEYLDILLGSLRYVKHRHLPATSVVKERTYYELIRELVDEEQILPEFSDGILRVWEEYLGASH